MKPSQSRNGRTEIILGNGLNHHRNQSQRRQVASPIQSHQKETPVNETPQKPILDRHPEAVAAIEAGGPSAVSAFMDRVAAVFTRNKATARRGRVAAGVRQRAATQQADDDRFYNSWTGTTTIAEPQAQTPADEALSPADEESTYRRMFGTQDGAK